MGEEPSYGAPRAGVQVPRPLPRLALRMLPSCAPGLSIIAYLNTTLFPQVPSSPPSSQPRPRPALFKAPPSQWITPTTHPPAPLYHLWTPPYCCALPPFFIFTFIPSPDLPRREPPSQPPWDIAPSFPHPPLGGSARAPYAPPWERSGLSVPAAAERQPGCRVPAFPGRGRGRGRRRERAPTTLRRVGRNACPAHRCCATRRKRVTKPRPFVSQPWTGARERPTRRVRASQASAPDRKSVWSPGELDSPLGGWTLCSSQRGRQGLSGRPPLQERATSPWRAARVRARKLMRPGARPSLVGWPAVTVSPAPLPFPEPWSASRSRLIYDSVMGVDV